MPTTIAALNKYFHREDCKIKIVALDATQLVGTKERVIWECLLCGNVFSRKLEYVKGDVKARKPPCKECSEHFYYNEELCRHILNQLLGKPFKKTRPDWLRESSTSPKLELDGFCESAKLAFEYQGEQHYFSFGRFTKEDVSKIQRRDEFKVEKCKEKGITLLVIEPSDLKKEDILQQIKRLLKENNIVLRSETVSFDEFLKGQSKTSEQRAELHAINKNYKLVKPNPLTVKDEDFKFFCNVDGHDESIAAKKINIARGCPACKHCGHERRAIKQKRASLTTDLISQALSQCQPALTLEKWAGKNQKGEHLCKCTNQDCAYTGQYAEDEIIVGAGKNICWGCKPNTKKRVQMSEVLAKVVSLGGECKNYSSSKEPITKKTQLTFSCFNSSHENFSLTVGQILDDQWCSASPCNERKGKKAVVGAEEILEKIARNFQDIGFNQKPTQGQNSGLDIFCKQCGHEQRNRNGHPHTYKSLKTIKGLECEVCQKYLGKGWQ